MRRAKQPRHDRGLALCFVEGHQILHEHETQNVVQVVLVHGDSRILLLGKERPEFGHGRFVPECDDVWPRGHDLAHQRAPEVDDRLQQLVFFGLVGVRLGLGGLASGCRRLEPTTAVRPCLRADPRRPRQPEQAARHWTHDS